jgi:hypothetical protein
MMRLLQKGTESWSDIIADPLVFGVGFVYSFGLDALVAHLDRVLGYEPRGREFESLRARQNLKTSGQLMAGGFFFVT